MPEKKTRVLFVDDDTELLAVVQQLMGVFAGEQWEIHTASDTAQAMAILREHPLDLLVLDVHMPVVDGPQFLKLLQRQYPNLPKVVLTGDATGAYRAACLSNGAELFLEKPRAEGGWESIYATLNELVKFRPEEQGFRGVLRRVGLQDVLQMECLARSSSVLEVMAGGARGQIFVQDGQIVHAQLGRQTGEEALYSLLAFRGGEFNLKPFAAPSARSIEGAWEFLLMEAARKRDESAETASQSPDLAGPDAPPTIALEEAMSALVTEAAAVAPGLAPGACDRTETLAASRPQVEELLVCSKQGEVLYEWQCGKLDARIGFLEFVSQRAHQLGQGLPFGPFDRLEIEAGQGRAVTQIQADHALFLRTARVPVALPA